MATISEIAARLEEANARAFSGGQLKQAAAERLKLVAEEGNVGDAADEHKIDLDEGNVGHEAEEFPVTVHLDAEGKTFGMTENEAKVVAKFDKSCKNVDQALQKMPVSRPSAEKWWARMRTELREGKFIEVRKEIFEEIEKYSKHTVAGEVDYVLSLQQVYDRI
ncbi:hypothetical protein AA313_de0205412 [Arthrobotrys entomopaga]|nr:hypothetical protein AA313_de0205412 [Arthrobotrys entomopaga]